MFVCHMRKGTATSGRLNQQPIAALVGDQWFVKTGTPAWPPEMLHADIEGGECETLKLQAGNGESLIRLP